VNTKFVHVFKVLQRRLVVSMFTDYDGVVRMCPHIPEGIRDDPKYDVCLDDISL
jgi:hypothetical protein